MNDYFLAIRDPSKSNLTVIDPIILKKNTFEMIFEVPCQKISVLKEELQLEHRKKFAKTVQLRV